jgi:hypothetical protein
MAGVSGQANALWTIAAHSKATTALTVNQKQPSLIATGSLDRTVKLWSIANAPSCLHSRDAQATIFAASFCEDSEYLLALGTSSGVRVWDTSELSAIRRAYLMPQSASAATSDEKQAEATAAAAEELSEIVPPGHGPKAEAAKEEKRRRKAEKMEQKEKAAKAKPQIPAGATSGKKKKRFAKPKFSPKKL